MQHNEILDMLQTYLSFQFGSNGHSILLGIPEEK